MIHSSLSRFVVTVLVALMLSFVLAALLSPPDPFSQLTITGLLMVIALPLAYYLSYRGGYESLAKRIS